MNRREFAGTVLAAVGLGGVVGRGLLTTPKPKTFALGFKITRAMIEDDTPYKNWISPRMIEDIARNVKHTHAGWRNR